MARVPVPVKFTRQMGCTPVEFVSWLERALPGASVTLDAGHSSCLAAFGDFGSLRISWVPMPPNCIGLLAIPQLAVSFAYEEMQEDKRHEVQRYFDMATQRGGG